MKRAILLTLAAGVATLPALWGVTGNTTFGQSVPAAIPSGASVAPSVEDRTSAPGSPVDDRGRDGSGSDDSATASALPTTDDRGGRGAGGASTPARATTVTSTSGNRGPGATATTAAAVDNKGGITQGTVDSSGHGGKGGSGKG